MADADTINRLERQAAVIRRHIIRMIHAAQSGHPGGSLSATDIVTALYFHFMRVDPKQPGLAGTGPFYFCPRGMPARSGIRPWPNADFFP